MTAEEIFEKVYGTPKIEDQYKENYHYWNIINIINIAYQQGYNQGFKDASDMAIQEIRKNYIPNK